MAGRSSSRGNTKNIFTQRPRLDTRKYSFGIRTAKTWNNLPEDVIQAKTLNTFKNRLDKLWKKQNVLYQYKATLETGSYKSINTEESSIEVPEELELENDARYR